MNVLAAACAWFTRRLTAQHQQNRHGNCKKNDDEQEGVLQPGHIYDRVRLAAFTARRNAPGTLQRSGSCFQTLIKIRNEAADADSAKYLPHPVQKRRSVSRHLPRNRLHADVQQRRQRQADADIAHAHPEYRIRRSRGGPETRKRPGADEKKHCTRRNQRECADAAAQSAGGNRCGGYRACARQEEQSDFE